MNRAAERLRDMLGSRVQDMSEETLREDGKVDAERLAQLENLARLVDIAEGTGLPAIRRRGMLAVMLMSALVVVSVLFFVRVRETEVELDLKLQQVGFVLSTQQVLTDVLNLSELNVAGLHSVQLPPTPGDLAIEDVAAWQTTTAVHLAAVTDGARGGTVSLGALAPPAGTRVWIQSTQQPRQFRLFLEGDNSALRAELKGGVNIALDNAASERRDFDSPRPILMHADSGMIDLTFSGISGAGFVPQLLASDLSFSRLDEFEVKDRTLLRHFSTILAGTLYFEELDGLALSLRPGESLRFGSSEGMIRTLQLEKGHIALKFHGSVRNLQTGWGGSQRSLMPTYLDWLKARHGLYLLWGTTFYCFGLLVGLMRWWGIRL